MDLTDAYFHVTIHPGHKFRYEFQVLSFGLSLALHTIIKCAEAVLASLHQQGMRVFAYLDDLLLASDSKDQTVLQAQSLVSHSQALGFLINTFKL